MLLAACCMSACTKKSSCVLLPKSFFSFAFDSLPLREEEIGYLDTRHRRDCRTERRTCYRFHWPCCFYYHCQCMFVPPLALVTLAASPSLSVNVFKCTTHLFISLSSTHYSVSLALAAVCYYVIFVISHQPDSHLPLSPANDCLLTSHCRGSLQSSSSDALDAGSFALGGRELTTGNSLLATGNYWWLLQFIRTRALVHFAHNSPRHRTHTLSTNLSSPATSPALLNPRQLLFTCQMSFLSLSSFCLSRVRSRRISSRLVVSE